MEKTLQVDYTSKLPEALIHHILSFLSVREIVQTSALSKTWYQAWTSFQILEFDFYALFKQNNAYYYPPESKETGHRNRQQLYNFVEQILLSRRSHMISLKKFEVVVPWIYQQPEIVSTMDRWIGHVIESHVKDLRVVVGPFNDDEAYKYNLPPSVLNATSIQVLHLTNCKLKLPCSGNITFPCLKRVLFDTVYADDNLINKLLSTCPEIEYLTLVDCYGIKTLHVSNLVKLVKIEIQTLTNLEGLKIEASNLESINLNAPSWPSYWPSEVIFASCFKNLETLVIYSATMTDKWMHNQLKQMPLLRYLSLFECFLLENIKISSSSLHKLEISTCKKVVSIEINTPYLKLFSYTGDIISFSSNHLMLPKAKLYLKSSNTDFSWYVRLIDLLANFSHCFEALNLISETGKSCIVPRELRQILAPPLCNFKELDLLIFYKNRSYPIAKLVDAMLWMSPHVESLAIDSMTKSSIKFLYHQNPTYGGENCCCKSFPVSCWWDCIKNVTIKQICHNVGHPIEKEEKNYLFNEDIWEKIEGGLLDWVPAHYR